MPKDGSMVLLLLGGPAAALREPLPEAGGGMMVRGGDGPNGVATSGERTGWSIEPRASGVAPLPPPPPLPLLLVLPPRSERTGIKKAANSPSGRGESPPKSLSAAGLPVRPAPRDGLTRGASGNRESSSRKESPPPAPPPPPPLPIPPFTRWRARTPAPVDIPKGEDELALVGVSEPALVPPAAPELLPTAPPPPAVEISAVPAPGAMRRPNGEP